MKFENISLPKQLTEDLMHIKWYLWRGDVTKAMIRFNEILELTKDEKHHDRIQKLSNYINNNKGKIVDYSKRKEQVTLLNPLLRALSTKDARDSNI